LSHRTVVYIYVAAHLKSGYTTRVSLTRILYTNKEIVR